MTVYHIDNDGDERTVDLPTLRQLAKRNGILDTDEMSGEDLADCIMDCYPDVVITKVEG